MVNPIKTPQEILLEQAGIPHMAGGGLSGGASQLFEAAVKKFRQITGRAPTAQEMVELQKHASGFSIPSSPVTRPGMSTEARAFHELRTDPNLMNPEGPDPFLTQAMLGRTPKGTRLQPKPADINDPQVMANIEARQQAGTLPDEIVNPSSITPTADYLANMSKSIEDTALSGGALDKLKQAFVKQHGRYPNEDELNALIADWNAVRHQYGEQGVSVVGLRPPTAKGMSEWRQQARTEGIPESALNKPPADYPGYLTEELMLQKGYVPAKKTGGHISAEQMAHEMLAHGKTPQRFAGGSRVGNAMVPIYGSAFNVAPSLPEMTQAIKAGKPTQALGGVYDIATSFLPLKNYVPLSLLTHTPTLGDATLDTYLQQKAIERAMAREKGLREFSKMSQAEKQVKPSDAALLGKMFPVAPEPTTDYLSGISQAPRAAAPQGNWNYLLNREETNQ